MAFIQLINTDVDAENLQFTDRIRYDGYDFSVTVSSRYIADTCKDLDFLFQVPKVSRIPNIANLNEWEFTFYDHKHRLCRFSKSGEFIIMSLPFYQNIQTDVSSGIIYLRIFHDTCKHLLAELREQEIIQRD